jgi:cell division septation protein DedD/nucleoid DNA-binding protein
MEKYLIELLETNNRVIVPDLGAFIIRQQEPQELVFNDLLAFNDGMLTTHIKQLEGISMSKAQVKIEEFVDEVKKILTKGDIYHLENLGYLKMDDSSKIEFSVTKFPDIRAEVVSASTIVQEDDPEIATEQPEKGISEETSVPADEETIEDEAPVLEAPEEEAPDLGWPEEKTPFSEEPEEEAPDLGWPEEEAPLSEVPQEEAPVLEVTDEEAPVLEVPEEEAPEKGSPAGEGAEFKTSEGIVPDEEVQEDTTEEGSFILDDQAAEFELDTSEDKPLIPDPEEPPFSIEELENQEEKKVTVVGTSQARLEAAAEAAEDEEINAQESEPESMSTPETNIPYFVEREKTIGNIWPWIGGGAALIIILLVAAWFFFPDEVNRILGEKSNKTVTTEEQVSNDPTPAQETTISGEEQTVAETEQDQEVITGEAEASVDDAGEAAIQEAEAEPEPEPEIPPAGQIKKYYVVAGMFSIRTNAEDLVKTLKAEGHNAELFGRHGDLYAVSFSSHESRAAAEVELNRIKEQVNRKAWLLYY